MKNSFKLAVLLALFMCAGTQASNSKNDAGHLIYHIGLEDAENRARPTLEDLRHALDTYESKNMDSEHSVKNELLGHKQFLVTYSYNNDIPVDDSIHIELHRDAFISDLVLGDAVGTINGRVYIVHSLRCTDFSGEYIYIILRDQKITPTFSEFLKDQVYSSAYPCKVRLEGNSYINGISLYVKIDPNNPYVILPGYTMQFRDKDYEIMNVQLADQAHFTETIPGCIRVEMCLVD